MARKTTEVIQQVLRVGRRQKMSLKVPEKVADKEVEITFQDMKHFTQYEQSLHEASHTALQVQTFV
ncbi:hypothetical protein J2T13_004467 [Paenibacillus sp. DS2015]|uniref:hypothetical protein n=1 Tax=Paenibacillus sp. DS2015 TaxID=3373917 RepID=UPI003D1F7764